MTSCRFLLCLMFCFLFASASCGKKGLPSPHTTEKPPAPVITSAIHRQGVILLGWSFPSDRESGITSFAILRSSGKGFEKIASADANRRSWDDLDIYTGGLYRYKVISLSRSGVYSDDSNLMDVLPVEPPSQPQKVSFTVSGNSMHISWEKVAGDAVYNVYKSPEEGSYSIQPLNTAPLRDAGFTDVLPRGKPVYYTVRALYDRRIRDEGPASAEIMVDPMNFLPPAPSGIKYFTVPDAVHLSWSEPEEEWIVMFRVYRRLHGGEYSLLGQTQIPSFVDRDSMQTPRDYRIHAMGPSKEGPGYELLNVSLPSD